MKKKSETKENSQIRQNNNSLALNKFKDLYSFSWALDNILSHIFWDILQIRKSQTVVAINYMMTRLVGCHFLLQGIFPPRDQTQDSCIAGRFFNICANREIHNLHLTQFQDQPQGNGNRPTLELMVNCNSNNKGDTDQTYFKMTVRASCAILQVNCSRLSPVNSWYSHLKTLTPD